MSSLADVSSLTDEPVETHTRLREKGDSSSDESEVFQSEGQEEQGDSEVEDQVVSNSSSDEKLSERLPNLSIKTPDPVDVTSPIDREDLSMIDSSKDYSSKTGDIGNLSDKSSVALKYFIRFLSSKFLLTGYKNGLIPDNAVRVSVKALALSCLSAAASIDPKILFETLFIEKVEDDPQIILEVIFYSSHSDPQLKGNVAQLIGSLLESVLFLCDDKVMESYIEKMYGPGQPSIRELCNHLIKIVKDDSAVAAKLAINSIRKFLPTMLNMPLMWESVQILMSLLQVADNPYWLVKVELLELIGELNFRTVSYMEKRFAETKECRKLTNKVDTVFKLIFTYYETLYNIYKY